MLPGLALAVTGFARYVQYETRSVSARVHASKATLSNTLPLVEWLTDAKGTHSVTLLLFFFSFCLGIAVFPLATCLTLRYVNNFPVTFSMFASVDEKHGQDREVSFFLF